MTEMEQAAPKTAGKTPIFTSISGAMLLVSLTTPMIMVSTPAAITIVTAIAGWFRRERFRWAAALSLVAAILMMFATSSHLNSGFSDSPGDLSKAQITDWNWNIEPDFGSTGTIKWRVEVKNLSDKPMESVKVEFTSKDAASKLLTSTFTFVHAIPPGESRTAESYADLYGTEKTANVVVSNVRYSGS